MPRFGRKHMLMLCIGAALISLLIAGCGGRTPETSAAGSDPSSDTSNEPAAEYDLTPFVGSIPTNEDAVEGGATSEPTMLPGIGLPNTTPLGAATAMQPGSGSQPTSGARPTNTSQPTAAQPTTVPPTNTTQPTAVPPTTAGQPTAQPTTASPTKTPTPAPTGGSSGSGVPHPTYPANIGPYSDPPLPGDSSGNQEALSAEETANQGNHVYRGPACGVSTSTGGCSCSIYTTQTSDFVFVGANGLQWALMEAVSEAQAQTFNMIREGINTWYTDVAPPTDAVVPIRSIRLRLIFTATGYQLQSTITYERGVTGTCYINWTRTN